MKEGNPKGKCFAFGLKCCDKSASDCRYVHELPSKEEIVFRDEWIRRMKAAGKALPWEAKSQAAAPAPKAKAKARSKSAGKSKTPCRNYVSGQPDSCPYGANCHFKHD